MSFEIEIVWVTLFDEGVIASHSVIVIMDELDEDQALTESARLASIAIRLSIFIVM